MYISRLNTRARDKSITHLKNMSGLHDLEHYVQMRVEEDKVTRSEISEELKTVCGSTFGLSERSIRRFCEEKDIHKTSRLSVKAVQQSVACAIARVMSRTRKTIISMHIHAYMYMHHSSTLGWERGPGLRCIVLLMARYHTYFVYFNNYKQFCLPSQLSPELHNTTCI